MGRSSTEDGSPERGSSNNSSVVSRMAPKAWRRGFGLAATLTQRPLRAAARSPLAGVPRHSRTRLAMPARHTLMC
ncbi:hypothetical protein SKAU_G00330220 [Synaphobranchus kaupii]|uniref:Uncharacterized protein n=1 Tax=Synaphobranchus kaupii TaxID=118154 RepID=A0A9Q1IKS4_SYNKA|nr:hypothetical protein SKAU_G00330220 [Synaphobranchus kaupii]